MKLNTLADGPRLISAFPRSFHAGRNFCKPPFIAKQWIDSRPSGFAIETAPVIPSESRKMDAEQLVVRPLLHSIWTDDL